VPVPIDKGVAAFAAGCSHFSVTSGPRTASGAAFAAGSGSASGCTIAARSGTTAQLGTDGVEGLGLCRELREVTRE